MNFFDLVTSSNLVAYWIEKDLNDVKVGDQLFPFKKEIGVKLSWIKGANNQVVGLKLSAYDSKSIRRDRQGIEKVETEMPFFKESMVVDEVMRQELNTLLQTQNEALIRNIVARIFNDQVKLIKAAYETVERVRMQLLTTGTITLASNGQSYTYDYGMPQENKITVSTAWSAANADPVKDITDAQKVALKKGHKLTRAMCNSNCLNALLNNTNIKNTLYVFANGNISITVEDVRKYIEDRTGITIYVNDNGYVNEAGQFTGYFADDTFVLMPAVPLGETHFGTTPEESDLMTGATKAEVSLVNNSVAVTSVKEEDPVNVMTKVSMVMLPSFEQADAVFILDVNPSNN
jgi:hypothetical protein